MEHQVSLYTTQVSSQCSAQTVAFKPEHLSRKWRTLTDSRPILIRQSRCYRIQHRPHNLAPFIDRHKRVEEHDAIPIKIPVIPIRAHLSQDIVSRVILAVRRVLATLPATSPGSELAQLSVLLEVVEGEGTGFLSVGGPVGLLGCEVVGYALDAGDVVPVYADVVGGVWSL
jgi:hypothetical protein